MRGLKTMLFGIAVICASGFFVVAEAVRGVSDNPFTLGLFVGLLLSFLGLLMSDGSGASTGDGTDEARGDGNGVDGADGDEKGTTDADDPDTTSDPDRYSPNRFPPM
ncbi:hypothetical protein [Halorussus sp. MSC15.2]|uniref:hypothetical protein n=1 Tax=Halorussus sp. MSC15.2 TaxID=2283638 RepID=UPI0013D270D7|nr:hypothetical protein [Halorussus sp. MSC15.2]NEU56866.1 hypothetical protein [Halorussus sp. MSC15.2]